jgi:hypothetical protein
MQLITILIFYVTIASRVRKARRFLAQSRIADEVLIADKGSTGRSQRIAEREGARIGYRLDEVPTTLCGDGRSRSPHLRTGRGVWCRLSFLLMFSPNWLFLYPGLSLLGFGVLLSVALLPGQLMVGNVGFNIHTFAVPCTADLAGVRVISFAAIARHFATARNLIGGSPRLSEFLESLTLVAVVLALMGLSGLVWCELQWASTGFGRLEYSALLQVLILSLSAVRIGSQLALTGLLSAIIEIPTR